MEKLKIKAISQENHTQIIYHIWIKEIWIEMNRQHAFTIHRESELKKNILMNLTTKTSVSMSSEYLCGSSSN